MADPLSSIRASAFLAASAPAERRVAPTVVTVALATLAAVVAGVVAVVLVGVAAGLLIAVTGSTDFAGPGGRLDITGLLLGGVRPGRPLVSYILDLAVVGTVSIAVALAFLAVCARRAGRAMASFSTSAPRFRWRHALIGLVVFLPVVALEIGLANLVSGGGDPPPIALPGAPLGARLAYALAAAGFLWLAALSEELLFRGWMLQQTHALTRRLAVVIAVNAVLFSLAHGDQSLGGFITRCAMGAGWAWVVLRLGGVEFTAGAHLANNLGIALLAQPVVLANRPEPSDPFSVALQVGSLVGLVLGVEAWLRWRKPGQAPEAAIVAALP
jgi:membrane protease YdiL (CAAX protease family)